MSKKPSYEELEQRVKELEKEVAEHKQNEKVLKAAYDGQEWQVEERTGELMAINEQLQQEITERQQAQEQLARFHQFVEASREGMGWADLDGRVRYINSALCNMFGETKPEDSYGKPVLEYYSEETQRRLQEEIFPTVLREGTWTGELVIHSSTGSLIHTTNSLIVLRDAEGNPSSFANVLTDLTERKQTEDELRKHRDHLEEIVAERTSALKQSNQKLKQEITERKKIEEALRKSEEKYRLLANNVSDVIWVRDMNLNLTYISPSVTDQQGYTVEEAMNRTPEEIWSPDSLKFIGEVLTEELEIEKQEEKDLARSRTLQVEAKCKDGSTIWTEAKMSFLHDQESHPTGIIGVTRDISERKRAEEALRESESKFRNLFDSSPQAIALTEIKSGRLVDINNKFCELTKYPKEEIIGLNTTEVGFYLEADRSKFLKELQASGEVNGLEMKFKAKDHSILHTIMFARIIQIEGKSFVLTIFHDITEQKRLEAQLQQALKMEAIGTLAGGIAHDFNNILGGIIGYTELAQAQISKDQPAIALDLEKVLEASDRAKELVQQILAFSRQTDQEFKPVKISLIIKEALKLLRASLPTTIEITLNIKNDATIWGEPTQLHQTIMNLCVNAGHAMQATGGLLEVNLAKIELDLDYAEIPPDLKPGQYLKLTVSDTGHGMHPEVLERIFDPFFTTKEKEEGSGMGLAVVHGIVKSHGGTITVDSEPQKGSVFNVFLPVIEERFELEKRLDEPIPRGTECILFIDDEKILVDVGKRMLESIGYDVVTRTSGIEALELFKVQSDKFDLVITDLTMPKMTGDELAVELLRIKADIPIVLCTGFSAMIDEDKAKAMGARAFVLKPILKRDIAETIRKVLDGKNEQFLS